MLTQQNANRFIGRQAEIELFKQWLADTDPDAPKILYLYDALEAKEKKGGVGKTWLLRKFAAIAEQEHLSPTVILIDFFDVASRDGVVIAERIITAVKNSFPLWTPTEFSTALKDYQDANFSETVENTGQRVALSMALAADLKTLNRRLMQANSFLLVMFDTAELIEETPSIAVLNSSRLFPDNYQFERLKFVIASRNDIDWNQPNWLERANEVRKIPVYPFNQDEMLQYLVAEFMYNPEIPLEQIQALYKRTEGRPILVGLVADVLNNHVVSIEELIGVPTQEFEVRLVLQILQLENPVNWVVLFMAHIYHRFNKEILEWILSESSLKDIVQNISRSQLMDRLPSLSFVRTSASGEYLVLHDEMRRLVNRYCWQWQDPDKGIRKDISRRVITYFEKQMPGRKSASSLAEQERQTFIVEMLFHMLFVDVSNGLQHFNGHFDSAIRLSKYPFARTMLQETWLFRADMSAVQQQDLLLQEAVLLRLEETPTAALSVYQRLEASADQPWLLEHNAHIYWERGQCYLLQSRFIEAVNSMERSLEIEQAYGNKRQIGTILNKLGYAYRKQGQFEEAQKYYKQALDVYEKLNEPGEYANIMNNLSNVDRLHGRTQLAEQHCHIALNIRKRLFQAGKESEHSVALSLSMMGLILLDGGHFVWGKRWIDQAYDIYIRLGSKQELAHLYNRYGQIATAREEYEEAGTWLRKAEDASSAINAEAYITSLNKQGRLMMQQQKWLEAEQFFERAVNKTKEIHDDYQQAENLVDRAQALYRLTKEREADKILQEARAISQQWDYLDLLGRTEEFLGTISYEAREYKAAFIHYRQYCSYMAVRNTVEYNKARTLMIDKIYNIPDAKEIISDFIAYWSEQNMAEKYPELIDTLEEIRRSQLKFQEYMSPAADPPLLLDD